jgi:hypothetical protein
VNWEESFLPPELHRNVRTRGNVHARSRRLLPSYAAAHSLEFKPGILCSLHGAAHGPTYE